MTENPSYEVPLYNIGVVARLTTIPISTLHAWERRYGFPHSSARTQGGHRLYSEKDVTLLRLVKAQIEQGITARQAVIATMGQIFGEQGLYHWGTFKEFCAVGDWANAKKELVLSQWHEEAPNSVERLANQLLTGEWA